MRWSFASPLAPERSGSWTPGLSRRSRRFIALLTAVIFALAFLAGLVRAAPVDQNQVLVPNATLPKSSAGSGATSTAFTFVAVLALASGGAWLLWRNRKGGPTPGRRLIRQLTIEETRSLGSRQYLVVASYQDKKFLLGVCPGRIDLLSPLSSADEPSPEKVRL